MAVASYGKPEIFNSDQGSQFSSSEFVAVLRAQGIQISMDGQSRCLGNVKMEGFWRTLKYKGIKIKEHVCLRSSASVFSDQEPDEIDFRTCNQTGNEK